MQFQPEMLIWLIPLTIWSLSWKGYGLWKSAKNDQLKWFVVMLIINTAGILPIIYIYFFQANQKQNIKSSK